MVKKRYFLLFLILICLISVSAQAEVFSAGELSVAPPKPPEEDEEIAEKLDVLFEVKDYDSKNLISDIHVNIDIIDKESDDTSSTLKYVGKDGVIKLRLYKGSYDITLKVDKIESGGRDYFIKFDQDVEDDMIRTVYLFSIGSVIGNVYDAKGKVVKGAQIKTECSGNYGDTENTVGDEFGSFSSYWLPIGSCRISAMRGYRLGYKDIEVKKGELSNIDIILDKGVISGAGSGTIIWMIIVVVIIAFVGVSYVNKKGKKEAVKEKVEKQKEKLEEKKEVEETGEKGLSSRTRDVMKTLKEKEIKIVDFLLENNHKSTQAKIRYSTGIPKTSLARILLALELKKIIKIEKIGKLKKVELTSWFLGKD